METTTPKASSTDNAIKAVSAVFGTAHFIFQSLADLTAHAEGTIVEKISKGEISKAQTITNRKNKTELTQANLLLKIKEMQSKTNNSLKTA